MAKPKFIPPVKTGDTLELEVCTLASSGDGIARHEGYTVFVPTAVTGDRVLACIVKTTPRFAVARVVETLHLSSDRTDPPCPVFPACGGCKIQHLNAEAQAEFKTQVVVDALRHLGKLEPPESVEILPADPPFHYRNKGSFALQHVGGRLRIGFFEQGSHEVVDSAVCDILLEPINAVKEWLRGLLVKHKVSIYNEKNHHGFLRGLTIRHAPSTGETLLGLVTTRGVFSKRFLAELTAPEELARFGIQGIVQNFNPTRTNVILGNKNKTLWGQDFITDQLGDLKFRVSLGSFFQVNPFKTVELYDLIRDWTLKTPGPVLDAYCGNGGISLWLARAGLEVTGIDEFAPAVADAKLSAEWNGLTNCRFLAGTLETHLAQANTLGPIRTLIVDPPRKGCSPEVIDAVNWQAPERIIYVSCNPATLARDLALLEGYTMRELKVIDMFPQTPHVETAVLLEKK